MANISARFLRLCQTSTSSGISLISKHFLNNSQRPLVTCGLVTRKMSSSNQYEFTTLAVSQPQEFVTQVQLNRPEKRNAMNQVFWGEMADCFNKLATDPDCRAVVLTGAGKVFTAGLDLSSLGEIVPQEGDPGRKALYTKRQIKYMQDAFNALEECPKPVIAAIQGPCVGGGVDMIVACDIRLASNEAWFQIKETELGMVADLGTLQRLPKIVGNESLARELALTGRKFDVTEAKDCGLLSRVFPTNEALLSGALEMAGLIASKSPIAVQGTKVCMLYARDNTVDNSLSQVSTWTPAMLQSDDVAKAVSAQMLKEKAVFPKL